MLVLLFWLQDGLAISFLSSLPLNKSAPSLVELSCYEELVNNVAQEKFPTTCCCLEMAAVAVKQSQTTIVSHNLLA